jgi:iron complex transport system substrate-binding protein
MRQALRIVPALLVAALAVSGCKGKTPQGPIGIAGNAGGTKLEKPARRIVSLSPSTTEVLALNGGSNWMMGRTESCNFPPFVVKLPVVMSGTKPDYEKIAKLLESPDGKKREVDLFVYDPSLFNETDVAAMAQNSRLKPFALDGDTVDAYIGKLRELSALYTGETFMSAYIDKIVAARNGSQADPVTPKPTVALILPGEGSEHMIACKDSFFADELRAATGEPVGPPGKNFVVLNPESLIQINPDIIITAGDSAPFVDDSRFQNLSAVKNNRVAGAAQDAMVRRGSRVPEVINQIHNTMAEFMHKKVSN